MLSHLLQTQKMIIRLWMSWFNAFEIKIKFAKLDENDQSSEGPMKQSFGQKSN